jgi:hypothetical protein
MQREQAWNSVLRASARVVRGGDGAGSSHVAFDEGVVAVCFVALVGVVLLGAILMLFSWVTTTLPTSPVVVCPAFDGCGIPTPDENQATWVGDSSIDGPRLTP